MANGVVTSHVYDPAGNELSRWQVNAAGVALTAYTAIYDAVGNGLAKAEVDGNRVSHSYDPSNQLVNEHRSGPTAINTTYLYDPLGNRLTMAAQGAVTTYAYNAANALTLVTPPTGAPTTMSYDPNGNLTLEDAGGALSTYTWDGENRMATAADPENGLQTNTYDATGQRTKVVTPTASTIYVRDGQNVLIEANTSGITQAHYTDSPGYWGGLTSQRRGSQSTFYGFDMSSNTRLLTAITGDVLAEYLYDAFGVELTSPGPRYGNLGNPSQVTGMEAGFGLRRFTPPSVPVNPFRFGGQNGGYRDTASRVDFRARVYFAVFGRWPSRDELGHLAGWNWYSFVENNPIVRVDPSGLDYLSGPGYPGQCGGEVPGNPTCSSCALQLYLTYDPTYNHHCNNAYVHCTTCCVLTRSFNSDCAVAAQQSQNRGDFGPGAPNRRLARMKYCTVGVGLADTMPSDSCASACLKIFGWPTCPGDTRCNNKPFLTQTCAQYLKSPSPLQPVDPKYCPNQ